MAPLPLAVELRQVYDEARDIAERVRQTPTSAHVLLALFTLPNHAQLLLADRKITEDNILAVIRRGDHEDPGILRDLRDRTEQFAVSCASREANCLHLLLAMTRIKGAVAHALLTRSGEDLTDLRNQAMGYLTGRMPRRYANFKTTSALAQDKPGATPGRDAGGVLPPLPPPPPPLGRSEVPDAGASRAPERSRVATQESEVPSVVLPVARRKPAAQSATQKRTGLDPEQFPLLTSLGRNLTDLARDGALDDVVGRAREMERMLDVLGKRRSNNPCLVGDPGVGKTALVEGLARRLVENKGLPGGLKDVELVELDMGALVAGTQLRGSFNERMQGLKEELRRAKGRVVIFVDELHTLVGAGSSGEGALDASNELKSALARGEFPCIGATTPAEYARHIDKDPALARRFVPILLNEPDVDAARAVLEGAAAAYEAHHGVHYTPAALMACVQLSDRFILDRGLPGKAVDVMDLAGSRAQRAGHSEVDRADVARVVSELAQVPLERLLEDDRARLLHMEDFLSERIVGHRAILRTLAESIRRAYAGFGGRRPMGSFLFLGPTGVGKTETVKALADFLFGSKDALVRLDMSEYGEAHAVARLIGSPPGYVGHDEGGQLTEAIRRRPYSLVLLDEVEKAHGDVLLTLLQVLDEGRLTDGRGRTVSFRNAVVVMTSNLGSEKFGGGPRAMGFAAGGDAEAAVDRAVADVLEVARKSMPPELWGRIEERLVFRPLQRGDVETIAHALLRESAARLHAERSIRYTWDDGVVRFLMDHGGYDATLGARPMRQAIQKHVESVVAEAVLAGRFGSGDEVAVVEDGGALSARRPPASPGGEGRT